VILSAEEQLVFGHSLPEMLVARDNLGVAVSGLTFARITGRNDRPKETGTPAICKAVGSVRF
jgi:hypothetical protein